MNILQKTLATALVLLASNYLSAADRPAEPGWASGVRKSEATKHSEPDLLNRPYRPLHFYGNTLRRMHYRGRPWPLPRDFGMTVRNLRSK